MMAIKPVFLVTDILVYLLILFIIIFAFWARRKEHIRAPWRRVIQNKLGILSITVLFFYGSIAVLDSVHFETDYGGQVKSLLDVLLQPLGEKSEKTYSAPFATHLYTQETQEVQGKVIRVYSPLLYGGAHLQQLQRSRGMDIFLKSVQGIFFGLGIWVIFLVFYILRLRRNRKKNNNSAIPHGIFLVSVAILLMIIMTSYGLSREYHILGTDKVGQDVFYEAVKSIRTGIIIGTVTTLVMLPFALWLGTMAGFFGGFTDDIIQYIYTTLSSIPGVLLIAASILSIQIFMSNHPDLFPTLIQRADARLLALCIILGITSWTSLCRLLRGETLKLREMDYVQGARALGVGPMKILTRHILPNVMHIIIITIVLDFSGLVLAEAILSYVGVGVDPITLSWGNMINSARLELAREPVVWWPLTAAFIFMFILVLFANLFSDAVRDAFDPRIKVRK